MNNSVALLYNFNEEKLKMIKMVCMMMQVRFKEVARAEYEQMFFVIDSRYRSRRPMIITTNLKLSELKNPPDLAHARIYDRILERCAPILFDGKNFREENAGATRQTAKDIVNSKQD